MVKVQEKLALQRDYIVQLLGLLTVDSQNTKAERRDIAECYPSSEEEFTFTVSLDDLADGLVFPLNGRTLSYGPNKSRSFSLKEGMKGMGPIK